MEIEFFNKDAREVFLAPQSVDLFLVHPPFFNTHREHYGGDLSIQLHNTDSLEEFYQSMLTCMHNMENALSDTGSILLILPNEFMSFRVIADIANHTNLVINRTLIWNFEKSYFVKAITGGETNLILHITKNENFRYPIAGLNSFVINQDWVPSDIDVPKYNDIAFVYDSFPHELSDFLVPLFSKEGDVVADIFGGTGTVAISALKNNRKAIYNDASSAQTEIARKRVSAIIDNIEKEKDMTVGQFAETDPIFETLEEKTARKDVIEIMAVTVEDLNREQARKQSPEALAQIESWIAEQRPNLEVMLSAIYDSLKKANVLK